LKEKAKIKRKLINNEKGTIKNLGGKESKKEKKSRLKSLNFGAG